MVQFLFGPDYIFHFCATLKLSTSLLRGVHVLILAGTPHNVTSEVPSLSAFCLFHSTRQNTKGITTLEGKQDVFFAKYANRIEFYQCLRVQIRAELSVH